MSDKKTDKKDSKEKLKEGEFIRAVGRRKTSVARVRLYKGQGDNLINELSVSEYFPELSAKEFFLSPFKAIDAVGEFFVTIKVSGGGKLSQAQAVAHGIARALVKYDEKYKSLLKKKKLLTRDPRVKERRKPGLAQSARAKKQSPKR